MQKGRRQALAVVLGQVLLGVIVAAACFAIDGSCAGASALLGAGIGVAATSLMAFAMLVIAFSLPNVAAVPLLAAYVATFFGYWFGAARLGEPAQKQ